jgi:hypothetical protein
VELATFIRGDLERLYMTGIDDEYFQVPWRREILLNSLLVWALQHKSISYRQGMHEIIGTIFYVLEIELLAWQSNIENGTIPRDYPLAHSFTRDALESSCYYMMDKIMAHLLPLYDPKNSSSGSPAIVTFCSKIQGNL